jgi:uncharacterized protein (TIGR03437 family)
VQEQFSFKKISSIITTFFLCALVLASPSIGQTVDARAVTAVSAASFTATMSPDSLGTIFSLDMTDNLSTARLGADGQFPQELGGLRVEIGGRAVPLIFTSPNQINFWIPPDIPVGSAEIRVVNKTKNTVRTGTAEISTIAPALFTIDCLNATAGAALNAVTFSLEPFTIRTNENGGTDKRTRLSIFGTGVRLAKQKAVFLVDTTGRRYPLAVEYAGPAPLFFGLDQINVVLAPEFDGAGVVSVVTVADGVESNAVTVNIADAVLQQGLSSKYNITTVAGNGGVGLEGDGGPALEARLMEPTAIAIDKQGNLYVADAAGHVVRRILTDGKMERFAGTGVSGFGGDGGPAVAARLQGPSGIAINAQGEVFIADRDNHRIRKINKQGVISTVAGTGVAGFSGDLQAAVSAKLSSPASVAVDVFSNILIADTGNHRVRRISADGKIATIAGNGEQGYSGDGFSALLAKFDTPIAVASDVTGVVYIADGKNYRIRRVLQDGTVRTVIGSGVKGNQDVACPALSAKLDFPLSLAVDPLGRILVSDSSGNRVERLDSDCTLRPVAGDGQAGFFGDGGLAQTARFSQPMGMAAAPNGDVYVADAVNHRVRRLTTETTGDCARVLSVLFSPSQGIGGQTVTGTVSIRCSLPTDLVVRLGSDYPIPGLPTTVTIPAGRTSVTFTIVLPEVEKPTTIVILTDGNPTGHLRVFPLTESITLSVSPGSVTANYPVTGTVRLGFAAPTGGQLVRLAADTPGVEVAATVLVPEGMQVVQVGVATPQVSKPTNVTMSASSGNMASSVLFTILPVQSSGPGSGMVQSLTLTPNAVIGGQQNSTGTVTLAAPAGTAGVLVTLSANGGGVSVPPSVTIPSGAVSAAFTVTTSPVGSTVAATITATSANSSSAGLILNPPSGGDPTSPGLGTISGLNIEPGTVVGGQANATGTVTLASVAPAAGTLINLSSNNAAASVPATIVIPQGQSSGSFTVTTAAVSNTTSLAITATSANSIAAGLTLTAPSAGLGTISSLGIAPSAVVGGQANATGTVSLGAPAGAGGVMVNLSSDSGAASVPSSIVIPQGQTSGNFTVTTSAVGATTTATITASSANTVNAGLTINAPTAGLGTISSLGLAPGTVVGGQTNPTGTVTLGAAAPAGGILVNLSSNSGAATVPASILIPQGQTSGNFTVTTSAVGSTTVATITASSTNTVNSGLTLNPPAPGSGTISGLGIAPSTVVGGQANATGTVTLGTAAPAGGILVSLSSNSGAASVPASIVIPQGQTSGNFTVTTSTVGSTTAATITATSANTMNAGLTIHQAINIGGVSVNPTTVTGGSGSTGTVTLSAPAGPGGVSVSLASNNAAATVPASVLVAQGQTTANFAIGTSAVASNQTANITVTLGSSNGSASLTIQAPCVNGLTLNVSSLLGGSSTTGTVTLTGPAPAGGSTITLVSGNGAIQVPTSVFVTAGQTSANFSVTTSAVALLLQSTIQALFGACGGITVNLDIQAPILNGLSLSPSTIHLLGSSTGTVSLNGPAPAGGATVSLSSPTLLGLLGLTMPSSVTIPAGQTSANFPVGTLGVLLSTLNVTLNATSSFGNLSTILQVLP